MIKENKKIFFGFLLCLFFCFLFLNEALGAEVSFRAKTNEPAQNQLFEVKVFLNTENENINAIEGELFFPTDLLEVDSINESNSFVGFWIKKPEIVSDGRIFFSGITPNGYYGGQGLVFSIFFTTKERGSGAIGIDKAKVLLNDGLGTFTKLVISDFNFLVSDRIPTYETISLKTEDLDSPEIFEPMIASNPEMFNGKYFLVFATQDKGSGIDYYAVYESKKTKMRISEKQWIRTESPYVLKDQKLTSWIYVKAVDNAGNERISAIEPRNFSKWYENYFIWIIIISGAVFILAFGKIIWRKKIKKYDY